MPPKELKEKPAAAPKPSKPKAKAEEKKEAKQAKQVKAVEKGKSTGCIFDAIFCLLKRARCSISSQSLRSVLSRVFV